MGVSLDHSSIIALQEGINSYRKDEDIYVGNPICTFHHRTEVIRLNMDKDKKIIY